MTAGLLLMKNVLIPLAESVSVSLALSAGISAADAAIQKKIYESSYSLDLTLYTTPLII